MKSGQPPNKGLQIIPLALSLAKLFHGAQHLNVGNLLLNGFGKSLWRNTEINTVNSLSLSLSFLMHNSLISKIFYGLLGKYV